MQPKQVTQLQVHLLELPDYTMQMSESSDSI